jgi:hypothetical protein
MKTRDTVLLMSALCVCMTAVASGQKGLPPGEVLQILKTLTSQPRDTWIPAGTIEAAHREYGAPKTTDPVQIRDEINAAVKQYQGQAKKIERTQELQQMKLAAIPFNTRYKLANEHTMDSSVTVKYDGQRFYWEIYIDSRQDSVQPDSTLAGNYMTDEIDVNFNRHRIFAWDGAEYTVYSVSGSRAGVDAADRVPRVVNGPLTAGLIPWGSGRYSYADLKGAAISAIELPVDGRNQVQMDVVWADGSSASFTLDPGLDYALTACTVPGCEGQVFRNYYGDYQQVAGNWVPSTILVEHRDASKDKLLTSDEWSFTSIDATVPSPDSFTVQYDLDTLIEYSSPLTAEPVAYEYSPCVDTRQLLADHLAYEVGKGKRPQNCATAAVGYVASAMGKTVSDDALASLVGPDGGTTLLDIKRLVEDLGLYCRAVHADLADLRNLGAAKAILYVPGKSHFVVLDAIEGGHARIIDLSNQKFCYEQSTKSFAKRWSDGVALLVSRSPMTMLCKDLDGAAQAATVGGATGYTCTRLIQEYDIVYCEEPCDGYFIKYFQRHGCEAAPSGECSTTVLYRYWKSVCGWGWQGNCTVLGDWYFAYILACENPDDWP